MTLQEVEIVKKELGWFSRIFKVTRICLPLGKYGKSNLAESDKWEVRAKIFGKNMRFTDFNTYTLWYERMWENAE